MNIYFLDLNNFSEKTLEDFIKKHPEDDIIANELKRKQHFAGRYLLEYVLNKEYKIKNFEIEIHNGKPFLKKLPYFFSISHSKNVVGLAIGKNNIGFDIEYNATDRNFSAISKRYGKDISDKQAFYKFWTRHEALIKLGKNEKNPYYLTGFFNENFTYTVASFEPVCIYNVSTINV